MSDIGNMYKTVICVAIAGALFITAVFYDVKILFFVAAFFDWLPLPTGWMRIHGSTSIIAKKLGLMHGVVTLIAYIIGVTWLFMDSYNGVNLGYLFLMVWFQAVMLGIAATITKISSS